MPQLPPLTAFHHVHALPREQLNCAKAICTLSGDKFDLLMSARSAKPSDSAADAAISDLKSVVNGHLREASMLEDNTKSKIKSAEAQRVNQLSAYRREEGIVAAEAAEVAAQVGGAASGQGKAAALPVYVCVSARWQLKNGTHA